MEMIVQANLPVMISHKMNAMFQIRYKMDLKLQINMKPKDK